MSHYGIIFCAYATREYVTAALAPWIAARQQNLLGHRYTICGVSCPFEGFPTEDDGTVEIMRQARERGDIDDFITCTTPVKEIAARSDALRRLVRVHNVDTLIQWDSDEISDIDEIARIIQFVEARPHVTWFKGSLKNLVFTPSQHLVAPFTPPRIHRVNPTLGYEAHSFWDDNNVHYGGRITRDLIRDIDWPHVQIPKTVQFTPHFTWLNNRRSLNKLRYQEARKWQCSFAWDDSRGGLIFNPALPEPEIARDE